ncbi:MAG: class I SAM-dependent methyltransferase [Spirochaetes bacterium]|nr:class I SAM-dependent methyltransferase [Spirochaetota bacterium]
MSPSPAKSCALCSRELREETKRGKFESVLTYHTCDYCKTSFLDERHKKDGERYYTREYEAWFYQNRDGRIPILHAFSDATARVFLLSTREKLAGRRVLDIGCGFAGTLRLLKALGAEVQGIEPSAACARFDREVLGLPVHEGFLESFPSGNRFDLITLFDVIEHVEDPAQTLRRAGAHLAEGGTLFFTTPHNKRSGQSVIFQQSHLLLFSLHSLDGVVREAGFTIREVLLFGGSLNIFATKTGAASKGDSPFPAAFLEDYEKSFLRKYGRNKILAMLWRLPRLARYHFLSRALYRRLPVKNL